MTDDDIGRWEDDGGIAVSPWEVRAEALSLLRSAGYLPPRPFDLRDPEEPTP